MIRHPAPPALPAGAIGFLAIRPDRQDRLALFHPDGRLSNTFGLTDSPHQIAHAAGLRLEAINATRNDELLTAHSLTAMGLRPTWAAFRAA